MSPVFIVLLSIADIVLYTIRSFTNKLFAISYDGKPSMATPIFSAITGFPVSCLRSCCPVVFSFPT